MRSDLLTVVAAYANPHRWRNRLLNFQRFEEHMLRSGVNLTTVECTYGNRPFELGDGEFSGWDYRSSGKQGDIQRIRLRARDVLWHKENLLNIGIARSSGDYVATIDGDFTFTDPTWASETVHMLQLHPVVQISSELASLGPNKEHLHTTMSLVAKVRSNPSAPMASYYYGTKRAAHVFPGGAWAYRRSALDALGGLLDICIVGAGDHHMAQALLGRPDPLANSAGASYSKRVAIWRDRAAETIKFNVGLVPGLAIHHWHGKAADRKYPDRWEILQDAKYDPDRDVLYDSQGLLQLTGNKPKLRDDLLAYFRNRNEDATEVR